MNQKVKIKKYLGVGLIILGLILFIEKSGLLGFSLVGRLTLFWPLGLILWGVLEILEGRARFGVIIVILGGIAQVSNLTNWGFWALFWPVFLVSAGFTLLGAGLGRQCFPAKEKGKGSEVEEAEIIEKE